MFERPLAIAGFVTMTALSFPSTTMAGISERAPRSIPSGQTATFNRLGSHQPAFRTSRRLVMHRKRYTPPGCSTNYGTTGDFFVGTPTNGQDVAGGNDSAVLGGMGNEACSLQSGVGAGQMNVVGGGEAAVAQSSFIAGGYGNGIDDTYGFIGGGTFNQIDGNIAFDGAGVLNEVEGDGSFVGAGGAEYGNSDNQEPDNVTFGDDAFVGAGDLNEVSGNGSFIGSGGYVYAGTGATAPGNQISGTDSFLGAGDQNTIGGNEAFIGAGQHNSGAATESFIGSGGYNTIASAASYGTVLGGNYNKVSGEYASILGGFGNLASGAYGIVAGGDSDTAAGTVSFAAGYHADAAHNGSFVWSDFSSGSATVKDTAVNQFVVRASGGTTVYSNEGMTSGVKLAAGSGTWSSLSDRNAKTAIVPLDDASVLAKVAALPVSTWSYTSERGVRHAGPMAQDFYAAFGVGEDDRHITSIDEDGIALAAVKALHAENARLALENRRILMENRRTSDRLAALEARDSALERELLRR